MKSPPFWIPEIQGTGCPRQNSPRPCRFRKIRGTGATPGDRKTQESGIFWDRTWDTAVAVSNCILYYLYVYIYIMIYICTCHDGKICTYVYIYISCSICLSLIIHFHITGSRREGFAGDCHWHQP